ncbi:cytochrome c3 family protein [Planctomycetota bacterium]
MRKSTTVLLIFIGLTSTAFGVEKPQTEQDSCVTAECHSEYASKKSVHDPVNEGSCEACHEGADVKKHTFKLISEEPKLCQQCHDQLSKKHLHSALDDGQCSQCHELHASDNETLLRAKTVGELCAECHTVAENATHLHGPTAVGECSVCHDPHESDHENLLSMAPDVLCVTCHEVTKDELEKFEFIHAPVRDNCVGCHDPHGANNWKMLKAEAPEMCFSCHEDIQKKALTSKHQHNIVAEPGGCLTCHTPHASTVRFLLASKPTTLCLTCHDKPLGMTKDEVLPAFTDQIKDKKFFHGPIQDGDCSGCHQTHGSDYFRLLAKEYPAIFYAPFDETTYALCFGCHEKTLVRTSQTDTLTDFRNGNQNLHFLHVNKDRRGRTCRACHQTHASNLPRHIRGSVPYGRWDLPINFTKTETGGSCSPGCHLPKDYDRQMAVDYAVKKAKP